MFLYLCKRLFLLVPVLFTVATLVFFLLRLIPGNPVDFILGENALPADRELLVREAHFDEPLVSQYFHYWHEVISGRLGRSYVTHEPVIDMIRKRYPLTLFLAFYAILWASLLAFPMGIWSALKKDRLFDRSALMISLIGISVPTFYLGPLLVLLFSIQLDWFPVSGRELPGSFFLPSLTLGLAMAAFLMRISRSSMCDVLSMDFVRTAKAKGVPRWKMILKHAGRLALLPVVAVLGLQFGTLLTGAIVTEKIFSWPGLGSLMIESIQQRDYSVVQGCILVIATTTVLVNLVTDLLYSLIDPRIELNG